MMIPNLSGLVSKLGITADTISSSSSAHFMNGMYPATVADQAKLRGLGKGIYDRFLNKVAENRHKTYDETRALAKGRVWTGEDAKSRGLVDVLGGLETAFSIAKKRMGIPEQEKVYYKEYPERKEGFSEMIKMFLNDEVETESSRVTLTNILSAYLGTNTETVMSAYKALPAPIRSSLSYALNLIGISQREKVIMAVPYNCVIE
jgi:protease-4